MYQQLKNDVRQRIVLLKLSLPHVSLRDDAMAM